MKINTEEILDKCKKNLKEKRSVATGIGVFAAIFKGKKVLLKTRRAKSSHVYQKDLSGKKELPGGAVDIEDFEIQNPKDYQSTVFGSLDRELKEETGLVLLKLPSPIKMIPAWLYNKNMIDLAFVIPIPWEAVNETEEYRNKLSSGELVLCSRSEVDNAEVVSERTRFLIAQAFLSVFPLPGTKIDMLANTDDLVTK